MFSIRGAALLFYSRHSSYTGHEIGADTHSKKAAGPALLRWRAKHLRPQQPQAQQDSRAQSSRHCVNAAKSNHICWTHPLYDTCVLTFTETLTDSKLNPPELWTCHGHPCPHKPTLHFSSKILSPHFNPALVRWGKFCEPYVAVRPKSSRN